MTIKDLFDCLDTDKPCITIYNSEENVIYSKEANYPILKFAFWDSTVAWIYKADKLDIVLRID